MSRKNVRRSVREGIQRFGDQRFDLQESTRCMLSQGRQCEQSPEVSIGEKERDTFRAMQREAIFFDMT